MDPWRSPERFSTLICRISVGRFVSMRCRAPRELPFVSWPRVRRGWGVPGEVDPSSDLMSCCAIGYDCNIPSTGREERFDGQVVARSAGLGAEHCKTGAAVRTKPTPRTLRIRGGSFGPSILRRNMPI
jgi:hypothetical protein